MKIITVAIFLISIFSSLSAFAEDRCIECRQAALREWQKCMAIARTDDDMANCKAQGQKLMEACNNGEGICKVTFSDEEKKDMTLVVDFVKNNLEVIRQVGNFKYASWKGSYKAPGEPKPSRYVVYLYGGASHTGRAINAYAVVDVSRLSGEITPVLACITNISPSEFRGPLKNICKQPAQEESNLWDAVTNNHLERAKALIDLGADVNQKNSYGNPILHHAVSIGNSEMVELLISKGADVNLKGQFDRVALHYANKKGMATILLVHGAVADATTNYGETPLHWAAHAINSIGNQVDLVEFAEALIKHGADVNKKAGQGRSYRTPLYYAAESNNLGVAKLLISHGADVNDGGGGASPLSAAGANGDFVEIAQLLVENGSKVNAPSPPLIYAAGRGNIKVTKYLLAQGANPDATDKNGVTALYSAASSDYGLATAAGLLSHGANPNAKNMYGATALHQAASQGAIKVIALLLANKADVNAGNNDGYTPLHAAVSYGTNDTRKAVVEMLLRSGANVNAKTTSNGETPLHKAISRGDIEIVRLLLDSGADVNTLGKFGIETLYYSRNKEAISKLLKEHGAK